MSWSEAVAGTGGGLIVAFVSWILGRSDSAATRRKEEIRTVAGQLIQEQKTDVRLTVIETLFPQIQKDIHEVKETVTSTNEKIDQLLLGGRLMIKKD